VHGGLLEALELTMGYNRFARKADTTTQRIVDELRAVGYVVEYIGRPVDIMVSHPTWPPTRS